jgi:hypothetical protein
VRASATVGDERSHWCVHAVNKFNQDHLGLLHTDQQGMLQVAFGTTCTLWASARLVEGAVPPSRLPTALYSCVSPQLSALSKLETLATPPVAALLPAGAQAHQVECWVRGLRCGGRAVVMLGGDQSVWQQAWEDAPHGGPVVRWEELTASALLWVLDNCDAVVSDGTGPEIHHIIEHGAPHNHSASKRWLTTAAARCAGGADPTFAARAAVCRFGCRSGCWPLGT